jgi:hypothetical protein
MSRHTRTDRTSTLRTYVVVLKADDGRRAYCYAYTSSADNAKALARKAELAPPDAVVGVRVSEFEEAER